MTKMKLLGSTVLMLCACDGEWISESGTIDQSAIRAGSVSVADFGAIPDDGVDDRAAFQAALDSNAADVVVPDGVYDLSQGGGAWNLRIAAGITLHGQSRGGTILRQICGTAGSVRLLQIAGRDVAVRDLTLDGQADVADCQDNDEHRAGTFVQAPSSAAVSNVVIERVTSHAFSGDGFYVFTAGDPADPGHVAVTLRDVEAYGNHRNGMTWGGIVSSGTVEHSRFHDNRVQQVDSETGSTGHLDNIVVTDNVIDGSSSNDYALTVSGGSAASFSRGWRVNGNQITGAVNVVWADDVEIANNVVNNPTTKSAVTIWRSNGLVRVHDNALQNTQRTVASVSVVYASGTGVGSVPADVVIDHNIITSNGIGQAFGVRAEGCKRVEVTNNTIVGPALATTGYSGIALRATIADEDFESAEVSGNTVRNWGWVGIAVTGNGAAKLLELDISSNTFDDTSVPPTQPFAIAPDADRSHAAKQVTISGSVLRGGCTTELAPHGLRVIANHPEWPTAVDAPVGHNL